MSEIEPTDLQIWVIWKLFSIPTCTILVQERHPYTGNLNSETSGDSQIAFLNYGDAFEHKQQHSG